MYNCVCSPTRVVAGTCNLRLVRHFAMSTIAYKQVLSLQLFVGHGATILVELRSERRSERKGSFSRRFLAHASATSVQVSYP